MGLLRSKKFWMSIAGVVSVVLSKFFGLSEETTMQIAGVIVAYVLGQGLADLGKSAKEIEKK